MKSRKFKGIPTEYKGCRFRSRLEARWAAFFDLLGWKWEYEPFDLNGWIPDFSIQIMDHSWHGLPGFKSILVEVKPDELPQNDTVYKIEKASRPGEHHILMVGFTPFMDDLSTEDKIAFIFGWFREKGAVNWLPITPIFNDEVLDLLTKAYPKSNKKLLKQVKKHKQELKKYLVTQTYDPLQAKWKEAGNITQWKPK